MTSKKVENYLRDQMNVENSVVAEGFQTLMNLYINKLWNQLLDEARRLICDDEFVRAVDLHYFYEEFIKDFERRIESLHLIELITPIAENIFRKDIQMSFEFLDRFDKMVQQDKRALVRLQSSKIQLRLQHKSSPAAATCVDLPLVRKMLDQTKVVLDQLVEVGSVHAAYYKCSAEYQRQMGDHKHYYEEALHYLGCEDIDTKLNSEQKYEKAVKLSIAALFGDGVYNFGELLAHPILNFLTGTPKSWLNDVLEAVHAGDWDGFYKYKAQIESELLEPSQKMDGLVQKLRLLCLMEMAHRLPAQRRMLRFIDIAETVRLDAGQVELLVMKAVANNLIDANIDAPSQVVNVSWVQPRVLSVDQIKKLAERTGHWCGAIGTLQEELQLNAHDLIA